MAGHDIEVQIVCAAAFEAQTHASHDTASNVSDTYFCRIMTMA